ASPARLEGPLFSSLIVLCLKRPTDPLSSKPITEISPGSSGFLSFMKSYVCGRGESLTLGLLYSRVLWFVLSAGLVPARAQLYIITDLGTNVFPQAINNNGDVAGYLYTNGFAQRAFFYTNGVATSVDAGLGTTNSGANAINNLGQSVGWYLDNLGHIHAFLSSDSA